MKKYNNYKNTGIERLGKIPEHWEVWKLYHAFNRIGSGTTPKTNNEEYYNNGTINWLLTGDLNDSFLYEASKKITPKALQDHSALKIFPEGSLVIAMYGATIGKLSILKTEATVNQACCVIPEWNTISTQFLFYWLLANRKHIISLSYGGGQPNISQEIIRELKIQTPPKEEQTAIANFLDYKTRQIDNLIAKKERLIELLKEERTAMINQAVIKGLDPNVPMKDSGIEWLGEIPEHWEVKRLKYVSSIVLGKMLTHEDKGGYHLKPYLRAQNINWFNVNIDDIKSMWFSNRELDSYRLLKYDLLVSEGGEVGRTCIWLNELDECYIQNSVHKVTFNKYQSPHYYLNLFYAFGVRGHFDAVVSKVSIAHLTREKLKEIIVIVPPFEEQQRIVDFIENKSKNILNNIKNIETEITLLIEYKTSLINEAVTGKIDVRDYKFENVTN